MQFIFFASSTSAPFIGGDRATIAWRRLHRLYDTPFAIKTDVKDLFPPDLPWTQRAFDYMKAFPQPDVLVVVDAPTPELVDQASSKLARALAEKSNLIGAVHLPQSGPFFDQNGLLYLPRSDVERLTDGLVQADPILQKLAADPSLRGALGALSLGVMGVQFGEIQLDDLARPMTMAADTVQEALEARPVSFSWRALARCRPAGLPLIELERCSTSARSSPAAWSPRRLRRRCGT
jgi:hypothetical protein